MMSEPRKPLFDPDKVSWRVHHRPVMRAVEMVASTSYDSGTLLGKPEMLAYRGGTGSLEADARARVLLGLWAVQYRELYQLAHRASAYARHLASSPVLTPAVGMAQELADLVEQIKQLTAPPPVEPGAMAPPPPWESPEAFNPSGD